MNIFPIRLSHNSVFMNFSTLYMETNFFMTSLFHLSCPQGSSLLQHVTGQSISLFVGTGIRLCFLHILLSVFYHQALSFPSITIHLLLSFPLLGLTPRFFCLPVKYSAIELHIQSLSKLPILPDTVVIYLTTGIIFLIFTYKYEIIYM